MCLMELSFLAILLAERRNHVGLGDSKWAIRERIRSQLRQSIIMEEEIARFRGRLH